METRKARTRVVAMVVLCACGILVYAITATGGGLEPIAPPGPTMHTLDEIYALIGSHVQEPKAFNCFVKFDAVDGESDDANHDKWSDFLAYSHGITQPLAGATGATRRRGDVVMKDFTLVKLLDKASPKLAEAACVGKEFQLVEIEFCMASDTSQTFLRYELTNAMVKAYDQFTSGATLTARPLEEVVISYEEIKCTYTEFDPLTGNPMGNMEYSWKVEAGG